MALRTIDGFDTVVPASYTNATGVADQLTGSTYKVASYKDAGSSQAVTIVNGWLTCINVTSATGTNVIKVVSFSRNLKEVVPALSATSVITGGVRIKMPTAVNSGQVALMCLGQISAGTNLIIFQVSDISGGIAADTEYYLEWQLDYANSVVHRWLNGTALSDITLTAAIKTLVTNGNLDVIYGQVTGVTGQSGSVPFHWAIRDIYINEYTADGIGNTRLGPIVAQSVTVNTATGAWTASTGAVPDALNTAITTTANAVTPLVTSDTGGTAEDFTLTTPAFAGTILGVCLKATGKRNVSGTAATVTTTVTQGGTKTTATTLALPSAQTYENNVYASSVAPDAGVWTVAKLKAAVLEMTVA